MLLLNLSSTQSNKLTLKEHSIKELLKELAIQILFINFMVTPIFIVKIQPNLQALSYLIS